MESVNFRYVYVLDPSAVLSMNGNMTAALQPVIKTGAGFLELNGTTSQLVFNAGLNIFPICVSQECFAGLPLRWAAGHLPVESDRLIYWWGAFWKSVAAAPSPGPSAWTALFWEAACGFDNGSTIRGMGASRRTTAMPQ